MITNVLLAIAAAASIGIEPLPLGESAPATDHTVTVLVKSVDVLKDGDFVGCGELSHAELRLAASPNVFDVDEVIGRAFVVPDATLETWERSNGTLVNTLRICKPTTYPAMSDQLEGLQVAQKVHGQFPADPTPSEINRAQFLAAPGATLHAQSACGEFDWLATKGTFAASTTTITVPDANTAIEYSLPCTKISAGHRLDLRFNITVVTSKNPV